MANLLFYEKPVVLNKSTHATSKLRPTPGHYGFARATNSVLLAGVEFTEAAKEFPIVFNRVEENVVPVAVLGFRNRENLFVGASGNWEARYVPAFVRRYPFVLAETSDRSQKVVCIDEAYEGFNSSEGEPLFDPQGQPTPILKQAMGFIEEYQKQYQRTEVFIRRLQQYDLLSSLDAKVDLADGKQFSLSGLLAIDERRLLALSDVAALEFFRAGELAWIYCHLMSLGCMKRIAEMTAKRKQEEA